ncbi:ATP-binding protein [Nocardioides sp. S5]|uniref:AlbA family DNA-binding domain-containing protein n=1 Tax=Nocardioides sp. S5 TaxID=2017486 RepID=UPI001A9074A6|nr:ATP-binding protein [Nocardioides sp. S5]
MSITNSAIHEALGETGVLDLGMVERAVAEGVRETENLDWKGSDPYVPKGDKGKDEFAKDVAAFANSRGGIIVIGVAEDRTTGRASEVQPFEVTDAIERRMRSWLPTRLHPPVPGLVFEPLTDEESQGVLAIHVPASPDAPHMVGKDTACAFPYRRGTQTEWMREFDLERAYRDRFARRDADEETLSRMETYALQHLDLTSGCWIVATARPTIPAQTMTPLSREDATTIAQTAAKKRPFVLPEGVRPHAVVEQMTEGVLNPRPGLRRWVMTRTAVEPSKQVKDSYVELHHDGSIVLALRTGGYHQREDIPDRNPITDWGVSAMAVDLTNLIHALSERLNLQGQFLIRMNLARGDDKPYAFLMPERSGSITFGPSQPDWSRELRNFIPVDLAVPPMGTPEDRAEVARTLTADMCQQFGISPHEFGWPQPSSPDS